MDLLTTEEAAEILRVKPRTLHQWRWLERGPASHRRGSRLYYERSDVLQYIADEMARTMRGDGVVR